MQEQEAPVSGESQPSMQESGAEAGRTAGEWLGGAAGEVFGDEIGTGPMAGEEFGEGLGGAVGEAVGGTLGAIGDGITEMGSLAEQLGEWATGHGGTDPMGGSLPPGGAPSDPTVPDGGADTGSSDEQYPQYDGGVPDGGQ